MADIIVNGVVTGNANNPQADMYSTFTGKPGITTSLNPADVAHTLNDTVLDFSGAAGRPGRGVIQYKGPWANPYDPAGTGSVTDQYGRYNQMMMTVAQHFDPFVQRKEIASPRWWFSRIPRGAFQLFNGLVHETRVYRGGLSTYAGLSQWEDIDPWPDGQHDPCAPLKYDTYQYGWETMAWKGKRAGWGSDPICLDTLKFVDKAVEQLGWILETGANYGMDMQEVWNRDMFIYQSVMAGKSIMMTSQMTDLLAAPRYVYNPFVKFDASDGNGSDGHAEYGTVDKPFIVFDATVELEPLNFDMLDQVREYLKVQCPEAAVSSGNGEPMFALAVSHDDVERYIRGNEEERKYWIEADPRALIQHYGFAPSTFRRWVITNDGNQLRFKLKKFEPSYTEAVARKYGMVGYREFADKAVWIAEFVPPRKADPNRPGVNGAPIPVYNPDYYKAEIAIAPVFMNKVFTNLFVPAGPTTLGSGTYFGPVTGLNGKWGWRNIVSWDKNPDGKIGNFYGEFEIVPKPELCVFECFSVLYRRCVQALPSMCPAENVKVNPTASKTAVTSGATAALPGENTIELELASSLLVGVGDEVALTTKTLSAWNFGGVTGATGPFTATYANGAWTVASDTAGETVTVTGPASDIGATGLAFTVDIAGGATGLTGAASRTASATGPTVGYVIGAPATKTILVQVEGPTGGAAYAVDKGATITVG